MRHLKPREPPFLALVDSEMNSGFFVKNKHNNQFANIIAVLGIKKIKLNFFSVFSVELKPKPGFFTEFSGKLE